MSTNNNNVPQYPSQNSTTQAQPFQQLTPASVKQLAYKFTQCYNEARRVGVSTPQGRELLKKASKIKAIYEAYNNQRQQAAQAFGQGKSPAPSQGVASPAASTPGQNGAANNNSPSNIRMLLTPQQSEAYNKLTQTYEENVKKINGEHEYLKRNIDILDAEIKKRDSDPASVKQIEANKAELLNRLRGFRASYQALTQKLHEDKKRFYIDCAATNPNLKRFLQATTQQQRANSAMNALNSSSPAPQTVTQTNAQAPSYQRPPTQQTPQQNGSPSQSTPAANSRSPTQVTSVNAAAHLANNSGSATRQAIFKQPNPSVPISETITQKMPTPVVYRSNRPTITGGSAMNAAALNTPVMTKLPPYEVDSERVMSKRKLRELVKSVGVDEGDGETTIDGDVEELLLDLADDFITNVTSFACRLAKHRKSDNLDVRDIQLHLERNWNIRVPGYAADEVRSTRKWNPSSSYNQKLQGINAAKVVKSANAAQAAAASAVAGNSETKSQSLTSSK